MTDKEIAKAVSNKIPIKMELSSTRTPFYQNLGGINFEGSIVIPLQKKPNPKPIIHIGYWGNQHYACITLSKWVSLYYCHDGAWRTQTGGASSGYWEYQEDLQESLSNYSSNNVEIEKESE
jgi:hypothetical protein